jgi:hypothetical protein
MCRVNRFDKAGFSIWRVDFKYNDELTQVFMSSNQIGGFFNRLEASRKYLFGSVGVLGTANNSVISGVFIARGPDINPVVEVAPDYESYDYKKLDIDNADDKKFLEGALAWDLEIDGKKWADGKAVSWMFAHLITLDSWFLFSSSKAHPSCKTDWSPLYQSCVNRKNTNETRESTDLLPDPANTEACFHIPRF